MLYGEGFDQLLKGKGFQTPLAGWQKTLLETLRRSTQQNLELVSNNFSRVSDQIKRLSQVQKPEELLDLQKDCLNENISATIENSQRFMHNLMENMEEFAHLCGTARETAMSAVKTASKKTDKHTERTHT